MKRLKAPLLALTLACLLATTALADGTMTSGGDRTSPPPPPPPATQSSFEAEAAPEADEAPVTLDPVREALINIASWLIWQ